MNRELRHGECKAYIREANLSAREERIDAEYCLHVWLEAPYQLYRSITLVP